MGYWVMWKEGGIKIERKRARSIIYFVLAETLSNEIEQIGGGNLMAKNDINPLFRKSSSQSRLSTWVSFCRAGILAVLSLF